MNVNHAPIAIGVVRSPIAIGRESKKAKALIRNYRCFFLCLPPMVVYIIYSEKLHKFYIGQTSDFEKRLDQHNDINSSYITKPGRPWVVFLLIPVASIGQAIKVEKHIKKMKSKVYIQNLKKYPDMIKTLVKAHEC